MTTGKETLFAARDLQAAIDEYVAAFIEEADLAAKGDGILSGPRQAARVRVDRAYQLLYAMSEVGRSRVLASIKGAFDG